MCAGCWIVRFNSEASGPSVTDWITAAATVGALIAAAVAAIIAWRVHVHNQTEKRAEQATRVAAWLGWRTVAPVSASQRAYEPNSGCVLLNSSALPVYDVVIVYWLLGGPREVNAGTDHVKLLPPGETVRRVPDHVRQEEQRREASHPTTRVEIRFTDASGRRWWRAHNGVLTDKGPWRPAPPETEDDSAAAQDGSVRGERDDPEMNTYRIIGPDGAVIDTAELASGEAAVRWGVETTTGTPGGHRVERLDGEDWVFVSETTGTTGA